ncbi:MAG: heavy metal translocating P-type ATPase [Caulobacteraceae bacterium]
MALTLERDAPARASEVTDRLELLVSGARCANCLAKIENALRAEPGVTDARLNLTTGKLAVTTRPGGPDTVEVIDLLRRLGYPSAAFDPSEALDAETREGRRLAMALGVAAFGAGNVMMFAVPVWAGLFGQELDASTRAVFYWFSALVATPCAVFAGMTFFTSAWRALSKGKANMDVPISIGVILTLIISYAELIQGGAHAYFDAAVTLIFLLLVGRYLDHQLRLKARGAARDLLRLQTPVVRVIDSQGHEQTIPTRDATVGALVAISPGDRIALDGRIESGQGEIDNAVITGETEPVHVSPGALVHAGALNLTHRLLVRVTAEASDSALAAIGRLMEAGAQSRSAYVRLADKAAAIYVPVVHTAAALTFVAGWFLGLEPREALIRAVVVLIVTCPCALGLAVPAVQITASGRLFRQGVLVKSGAALERLAEVDHVVFDKTGVLTAGRPRLMDAPPRLVAQAAVLARASRHPLAQALAANAGPGPTATVAEEVAGQGVVGIIDGRHARLGRAEFVGVKGATASETELWFGFEDDMKTRFRFEDSPRDDAAATIAALRKLGLTVEVLSGDLEGAVQRVAKAAGIEHWRAGLTPFEKAEAMDALKAAGRKVLMVGDGLNDAAALAKAHASMAPGAAVDAAHSAADMVWMGEGLGAVALALEVARAARARALENFAFSALYNLVAMPAAMFGLVNPLVAALAMSGSSLVVTANALRMARAGRQP